MSAMESKQWVEVPLFERESKLLSRVSGVTTVSFVKVNGKDTTSETVFRDMRLRLFDIVKANPWVCARLRYDPNRTTYLPWKTTPLLMSFPDEPTDADVDAIFQRMEDTDQMRYLSPSDHMQEIQERILSSPAAGRLGKHIVGTDHRVTAITVGMCANDPDTLVLVFHVCHTVVDGHTYYQLLQMMSYGVPIVKMNPYRKEDTTVEIGNRMHKDDPGYFDQTHATLSWGLRMIFGNSLQPYAFYVDQEKVRQAKEEARQRDSTISVSTNDIIVSTLANAVKPRMVFMAVNWRNRIKGLIDTDAGNYGRAVGFDPESYSTPEMIRRALTRKDGLLQRMSNAPAPGILEGMTCKMLFVTNWTFPVFTANLQLCADPNHETTVQLHLPLFNYIMNRQLFPFSLAVIFRASPGRLGTMYWMRDVNAQDLRDAGVPLGEPMERRIS